MANVTKEIFDWYWDPSKWFPYGIDWDDISKSKINYPNPNDVQYHILIAAIFIFVQRQFKRACTRYAIKYFSGSQSKKEKSVLGRLWEEHRIFNNLLTEKNGKLSPEDISQLIKKTDLSVREIERLTRNFKRYNILESKIRKFNDCGWRILCRTTLLIWGCIVLIDKEWVWDTSKCWRDYPFQNITNDIWWYYSFITGYTLSQLICLIFLDAKGNDFWETLIHHTVSTGLCFIAWYSNLIRVGTLLIFVHDCADALIAPKRLCSLTKQGQLENFFFATFVITWTITRVIIYPVYVISSVWIDAPAKMSIIPGGPILKYLMLVLYFLHLFWTVYIYKLAWKGWKSGMIPNTIHTIKAQSSGDECEEDD